MKKENLLKETKLASAATTIIKEQHESTNTLNTKKEKENDKNPRRSLLKMVGHRRSL